MLCFGPESGPVVVAALPLLEEANRTRALAVAILRALAERGVAGALPELPGTGESLVPTEAMTLPDLRRAFAEAAEAAGAPAYTLAIRSGALLDTEAEVAGRWLLAPQGGDDLLREWRRIAGREATVAGNAVSDALLAGLAGADVAEADVLLRTVRLDGDPRAADRKIGAQPLWRSTEPGSDPALAALLADDIAAWVRACEG